MEVTISRKAIQDSIDHLIEHNPKPSTKLPFEYYLDGKLVLHFHLKGSTTDSSTRRLLKPIKTVDNLLVQGYSRYCRGRLSRNTLTRMYCNELETLLRLQGYQTIYTK